MSHRVTGISDKIPNHLKDLFELLLGETYWLREQWQMYETLYGSEEHWKLLNKSSSLFFYMVDYLFIDNFILALSRLGDPAQQNIKKQQVDNFTLEQLLSRLDPIVDAGLVKKLRSLLEDYKIKCAEIREQRNKRVGHSDLKAKMEPDKHPLPDVSREKIEQALITAEDFLNTFECHFLGEIVEPARGCISSGDAHILMDRLWKAIAYDKLHDEGKIEVAYAHKLASSLKL